MSEQNRVSLSELIPKAFHDLHREIKYGDQLFYVCKGGRNSGKSSVISIEIVKRRMESKSHALCIRKWGVYLEKSVYEQCKWAINALGVQEFWKINRSPLRLTYKPTGASIFFAGADDTSRIKSIKMSDMPITELWIEEVGEFKTEDEVTTVTNSIVRAELPASMDYKIYLTYNPPKRRTHWLNKKYDTVFVAKNTYVHHSTYKGNPHLSRQALEEIRLTKINNKKKYEWDFLGKPTGSGVVPFQNLVFRPITDEEIAAFDNIRQGIDWGYGIDPACFGRMHYYKTRGKLFIFDEIYGVKMSNSKLFNSMLAEGYGSDKTTADSSEPKSVAEGKSYGLNIKGAKKGAGSVEYGEKWLDELEEIVIDPVRCPNIAREFEGIDYAVDKDGNPLNRLVDADNHSIDMVRYAMEDDMKASNWGWKG